ncbi:aspartate aminotransferase family protein [Asticcacaulis machinosus]|uniref:Aspartate aminotransferase family protein n=1 Tax=Asticcacaulis machinosus TaxID=2984211 RepID=A0ABT5HNH6_9CAUL|nr:aspartate aminotransferase family protein [Asticcacaulis machinosus]MDC7677777.1 aspartate aminotransferase family protein [Asticcacaulis machinosus]
MTQTDLITRRERLLGPAYRLFYDEPAHFVRGEGVWLYDAAGDAYLDVYNNVASLGHCHPRIALAITRQVETLNTHTRYLHETILDCAETLLATLPDHIDRVMFTCSGSEANDLAVRIAEAYTGRTGIIVTELAYHGVTQAVSQMSPSLGEGVVRGPHIFTVPSPLRFSSETRAAGFAQAMDDVIARMTKAGFPPALFICDTLFSSDGVISDPAGFLKPAVERVQAAGGLFVADEVQAGFGRTGEAMWGFQRHGLSPDLVSMGKPMGNGHPVAGIAMRAELIEEFGKKSRYFNTFGGNPVSCAAALAVLNVIAEDELMVNVRQVGAYLTDGLRTLGDESKAVGEVRGAGLFFGVDIVTDGQPDGDRARRIVNHLRQHKVLISATGQQGNVLKIRPPLVFRPEHADRLMAALSRAVSHP